MTEEQQRSMEILQGISRLLADHPGTLQEHQQRLNSVNFLRERLEKLQELETGDTETGSDEVVVPS